MQSALVAFACAQRYFDGVRTVDNGYQPMKRFLRFATVQPRKEVLDSSACFLGVHPTNV